MSNSGERLHFGDFELDVAGYELRGSGRAIRLERQPMDLLLMLVERRGQLVSREDIIDRLWGKDVFVDVDTGVHTAVRKIRRALRDSPEEPTFIETVSGKGYRFIAPVEVVAPAPRVAPAEPQPESEAAVPSTPGTAKHVPVGIGLLVVVIAIAVVTWMLRGRDAPAGRVNIAVLPFENLGVDPDRAYLADGLTEEIIA